MSEDDIVTYQDNIAQTGQLIAGYNGTWDGIGAEAVARMRAQNRFRTGPRHRALHRRDHAPRHGGL